ncbi:MAG: transposase [Caldivirga sp.]|jgi:putative transposase|nr:transposase [Caldivirga sp.]
MNTRRAIIIRLPKDKCDVEYIRRLMALTNLAYRGFEVWVPDLPKTIQNHLYGFRNFKGSLVFGTKPKGWFARAWVPLKTLRFYPDGLRKGGRYAPVVLDFKGSVIKLYQVCRNERGYVVEVPMPRWVVDRIKEGGDVKYAMIGLKDDEPYLALIAEREVEPYIPSDYMLAIDVNAWNNGIAWGLIKNGNIIKWKPERPRLREIDGLYYRSVVLSQKYGKLKRLGLHKTKEGKGLWREVRRLRRRIYAKLRDYAQRLAHRLVRKALRHRALVIIDDIIEESRRELLEGKLPSGLRKIYLAETRRFVKLLIAQLEWYGVPYEFKRLPSTICPICGSELTQLPGRIMVCENCGFKAPRDKIPIHWAMR